MVKFTVLLIIGLFISGCSNFGTRPSDQEKEKFRSSKQFNAEKGSFENSRPEVYANMRENSVDWGVITEWFSEGVDRVPKQKLPEIKPNMKQFLQHSEDLKIIWFGHSSFLLNMDGKLVLVDPVFSGSASPVPFLAPSFQKSVLDLGELPEIDYILLSHDHYDHLDMESIKFFVDKKGIFIAPLGVSSHLRGWGIDKSRIIEKDWWESVKLDGVEFIATPAQHFSGRNGIIENETLWASWVIQSKNHKIYFSGDSGYDTHFKEIGEKYGPFDVAFIESGQYNEKWRGVHLFPEEAVVAFHDLKAKKFFPVHWGMFELAFHPWYDPIEKLFKLSKEKNFDLIAPKLGQIVNIEQDYFLETWWKNLITKS